MLPAQHFPHAEPAPPPAGPPALLLPFPPAVPTPPASDAEAAQLPPASAEATTVPITLPALAARYARDAALTVEALDLPVPGGRYVHEEYEAGDVRVVVQVVARALKLADAAAPLRASLLDRLSPAKQRILRACRPHERLPGKVIAKRIKRGKSATYQQLSELVAMGLFTHKAGSYTRVALD